MKDIDDILERLDAKLAQANPDDRKRIFFEWLDTDEAKCVIEDGSCKIVIDWL